MIIISKSQQAQLQIKWRGLQDTLSKPLALYDCLITGSTVMVSDGERVIDAVNRIRKGYEL